MKPIISAQDFLCIFAKFYHILIRHIRSVSTAILYASPHRYDQFGPALLPSPGHLIGSGTIGRLVPFSVSAIGGTACQFFFVMGTFGVNLWGLGCVVTAGVSWVKTRASSGRADSVGPAILGGLLLGNVAGLCLGVGTRGAMRLLRPR